MKLNKLTAEEKRVIVGKGTEAPFSGEYVNCVNLILLKFIDPPTRKAADGQRGK